MLQAIGGGLTGRIIDGYVAIISIWQPGDRIYLFGFSRGAYTARCIANVLECVGIPTRQEGDQALSFEPGSLRRLAREGVRTRYSHGLPIRDVKLRNANSAEFRKRYACAVGGHPIGALPYFIGIWDTVAALGWNHFLIFGERHLQRILALYSSYYNGTRTHLALGKDAPLGRAVQRSGIIVATPILSGLHHRYARI
jgi:uncharacterized protein (DUF2235 family)